MFSWSLLECGDWVALFVCIDREQLDLGVTCPNRGLLLLYVVWNCVVAVWDVSFGPSLITLLIYHYHLAQSATFLHVHFFVFSFLLDVLGTAGAPFEVGGGDGAADVMGVAFQLRVGRIFPTIPIRSKRTQWLFSCVSKRLLLVASSILRRCILLLLLIIPMRWLRVRLISILFLRMWPHSFTSSSAFSAINLLATFIKWVRDHFRFTRRGSRFNWRQFRTRSRLLLLLLLYYLLLWLLSFKQLFMHYMYLGSWHPFRRWTPYCQIWGDEAGFRSLGQYYIIVRRTSLSSLSNSLVVLIYRCGIPQAGSVLLTE